VRMLFTTALFLGLPVSAAPPPPPPPGETEMVAQFFEVAPTSFPANDLTSWTERIDANVQVFDRDRLVFDRRDRFIQSINSCQPDDDPKCERRVERSEFFQLNNGRIRVLEKSYKYSPDAIYHSNYTHMHVTYKFNLETKLVVEIRYGERMRRYKVGKGFDLYGR